MTATVEMGQDEYVVDNPRLRAFVAEVTRIRHERDDPREILAAIRPHFAELLADKTWLPEQYQAPGSSIAPVTAASPFRRWSSRQARKPPCTTIWHGVSLGSIGAPRTRTSSPAPTMARGRTKRR